MTTPKSLRHLNTVTTVVIHCADTRNGSAHTADDIDGWHRERGWRRSAAGLALQQPALKCIGYHAVIEADGTVVPCRHIMEIGAHVGGHNRNSVGVCLVGRDKFSLAQWHALRELVARWEEAMPIARIAGHREFNAGKTCPGFSVMEWLATDRQPLVQHLLTPKGEPSPHGNATPST